MLVALVFKVVEHPANIRTAVIDCLTQLVPFIQRLVNLYVRGDQIKKVSHVGF